MSQNISVEQASDLYHPNPEFRRKDWIDLNGAWRFRFDDDETIQTPSEIAEWPLSIQVPFPPESELSGVKAAGFHHCCWYERDFEVTVGSDRLLMHFEAVDYEAHVWVNGHFVGRHEGGHVSFTLDVTPYLKKGTTQTITVRAHDDPHDLAKPRGKQDWLLEPHSIWYHRTTGIWQSVWAEVVAPTHLDRVRWSPHLERWEIGLAAFVAGNRGPDLSLKVKLTVGAQLLAEDTYKVIHGEIHRSIALSDPGIDDYRNELLWSPERPTLIVAELELIRAGEVIDRVESYTALRSVAIHRDRFMMNGRPYYLRLVLDQGYWPQSLMTAPDDESLVTDILAVKKMGFNGVRKHQKIESRRFLYWADRLGLLVWEEMPSAYRFTHESVERLVREWIEVIDRDSNHPCIAVWVPFNESWGVPDLSSKEAHRHCVQTLYHLTKTLDPTRPVVGNDGWESVATDILGIHDYEGDPGKIEKRYHAGVDVDRLLGQERPGGRVLTVDGYPHGGQPLMLTEFGGISLVRSDDPVARKAWGYSRADSSDDLRNKYTNLLKAIHRIGLFGGFCYTQLTDTFQETNGLLFADRTPKFPFESIRAATCATPEGAGLIGERLPETPDVT